MDFDVGTSKGHSLIRKIADGRISPVCFRITCLSKCMAKKILLTILVLIFLTSCISITKDVQNIPAPTQNFVTATLIPTKAQFIYATLTATPESSATSTLVATVPAKCTNAAILLRDVTIQDDIQVNAGEKFTKTWEFQNTGTCPWVDYTIKFSAGDQMNAPLSTPIADTLPSGKVQVSVELTAPTADGKYTGYFTLLNSSGEVIPVGTQKTFWVRFVVGAYAVIPPASGTNLTPPGNCIHSQNANYVSEIISLINAERANVGLPALTANAQLAAFAQSHAEDMAYNNFLSHDGSNGSFSDRMVAYGVFGEILAIGTPQDAMNQWRMDEHWDFVLGSSTQIGVGYAYNSCSDYGGYFTVDFQ
jgi:uncharacterized protein YkwD